MLLICHLFMRDSQRLFQQERMKIHDIELALPGRKITGDVRFAAGLRSHKKTSLFGHGNKGNRFLS